MRACIMRRLVPCPDFEHLPRPEERHQGRRPNDQEDDAVDELEPCHAYAAGTPRNVR